MTPLLNLLPLSARGGEKVHPNRGGNNIQTVAQRETDGQLGLGGSFGIATEQSVL
jgi:hypothetical protein